MESIQQENRNEDRNGKHRREGNTQANPVSRHKLRRMATSGNGRNVRKPSGREAQESDKLQVPDMECESGKHVVECTDGSSCQILRHAHPTFGKNGAKRRLMEKNGSSRKHKPKRWYLCKHLAASSCGIEDVHGHCDCAVAHHHQAALDSLVEETLDSAHASDREYVDKIQFGNFASGELDAFLGEDIRAGAGYSGPLQIHVDSENKHDSDDEDDLPDLLPPSPQAGPPLRRCPIGGGGESVDQEIVSQQRHPLEVDPLEPCHPQTIIALSEPPSGEVSLGEAELDYSFVETIRIYLTADVCAARLKWRGRLKNWALSGCMKLPWMRSDTLVEVNDDTLTLLGESDEFKQTISKDVKFFGRNKNYLGWKTARKSDDYFYFELMYTAFRNAPVYTNVLAGALKDRQLLNSNVLVKKDDGTYEAGQSLNIACSDYLTRAFDAHLPNRDPDIAVNTQIALVNQLILRKLKLIGAQPSPQKLDFRSTGRSHAKRRR